MEVLRGGGGGGGVGGGRERVESMSACVRRSVYKMYLAVGSNEGQ